MQPLTISQLTSHIVQLFQRDDLLRDVWISGEVSNWNKARSGHVYFTLKDGGASINGVMWKGSAFRHTWLPGNGDQIIAHGYVDVYPDRGAYQFYADQIQPAGRGQLYAQFEALKEKLRLEGLFDPERKRPIPGQPQRIGIITSDGAAALRDVLRVLAQRWPLVDVMLFHTLVQGSEAPAQIVAALEAASRVGTEGGLFAEPPLETLLLVRGGGSIEDLWAFNDEKVARAVARSPIPIITGVGHETDFTMVDFVADLRAPTPSAAAAAAVPDGDEWQAQLRQLRFALPQMAQRHLAGMQSQLEGAEARLQRLHPGRILAQERQRLDDAEARLHSRMNQRLHRFEERLAAARQRLESLGPQNVLKRGYSVVQAGDGRVLTSPEQSQPGDELSIRAAGGRYTVRRA
jgi:exodeoxyribonuclease VII large subunit